jgi:1,4-dihydroxy-2-naphthoate octaprenyltransferase
MRRFALLLFFGLALGQTLLPVEELGLTFREEGGAWVYQGGGKRFVYVPLGRSSPRPKRASFPWRP